jgi:hypothetical protein
VKALKILDKVNAPIVFRKERVLALIKLISFANGKMKDAAR